MRLLLVTIFIFCFTSVQSKVQEIVVGVHPGLTYPDFSEKEGKSIGIIPSLFETFAKAKGYKVSYKMYPRKRMDELVKRGDAHARCLVAKSWVKDESDYLWSRKIFRELSTFVRLKKSPELKDFSGLKGKSFAGILGFVYGPELTEMASKGEVKRFNVIKVEKLVKMVLLRRADVAIESQRVLKNLIKDHDELVLTQLTQGRINHYCLFSKNVTGKPLNKLRDEFNEFYTDDVLQKTIAPYDLSIH
ncbi:MAG: transporter substrate-binding domain-containing protein [Halobacteriovoraceae bacterium]|nr:transporter substrate-binding domain-containing protein [Halobacteriovoraceae bacterium]